MRISTMDIVLGVVGIISLALGIISLAKGYFYQIKTKKTQLDISNEIYRALREQIYGDKPHNPSWLDEGKDGKFQINYGVERKNGSKIHGNCEADKKENN